MRRLSFLLFIFVLSSCLTTEEKIEVFRKNNQKKYATQDMPFKWAEDYSAVFFMGEYKNLSKADTWYPSWGADDKLYSPFTDGEVSGITSFSGGNEAVVGYAMMGEGFPDDLQIKNAGLIKGNPAPYGGRYPCASLMYNDVWYIGTYGLNSADYGLNWPVMGPFFGFHISRDKGRSWEQSPVVYNDGSKGLFNEPLEVDGPVRFGSPHFVDFGKNMMYSPDGNAYLIAHGSREYDGEDRIANLSWISGDSVFLSRVKPSPETINNPESYEFFSGKNENGEDIWVSDINKCKPLFDWDNNCGCVTMTWNEPLKKFLVCITDGWPTTEAMNSYILISDNLTGPFEMVAYLKDFGPQAYFLNIPSKFISDDGMTFWICYSANFTTSDPARYDPTSGFPEGSCYSMSLQKVELIKRSWRRY